MKYLRTLALVFTLSSLTLSACNFSPTEDQAPPDTGADAPAQEREALAPPAPEPTEDGQVLLDIDPEDEDPTEPLPTDASEEQSQDPAEPEHQNGEPTGPESFPEGINPLTGERVYDPAAP